MPKTRRTAFRPPEGSHQSSVFVSKRPWTFVTPSGETVVRQCRTKRGRWVDVEIHRTYARSVVKSADHQRRRARQGRCVWP